MVLEISFVQMSSSSTAKSMPFINVNQGRRLDTGIIFDVVLFKYFPRQILRFWIKSVSTRLAIYIQTLKIGVLLEHLFTSFFLNFSINSFYFSGVTRHMFYNICVKGLIIIRTTHFLRLSFDGNQPSHLIASSSASH